MSHVGCVKHAASERKQLHIITREYEHTRLRTIPCSQYSQMAKRSE